MIFACGFRLIQGRKAPFMDEISLIVPHSDEVLLGLGDLVKLVEMDKSMIGWNIEELETVAGQIWDGERETDSDDESASDEPPAPLR